LPDEKPETDFPEAIFECSAGIYVAAYNGSTRSDTEASVKDDPLRDNKEKPIKTAKKRIAPLRSLKKLIELASFDNNLLFKLSANVRCFIY